MNAEYQMVHVKQQSWRAGGSRRTVADDEKLAGAVAGAGAGATADVLANVVAMVRPFLPCGIPWPE